MSNIAYFYVTGNVDIYCRIPKRGAGPFVGPADLAKDTNPIWFVGHTEKYPQPSYQNAWKPVFSSQMGEVLPADKIAMGQEVKITLPLQRFDYDVLQLLKAFPRAGRVTAPGTMTYLDIGALLQRNGLGVEFWLKNAFHGTVNQQAYPDLPIGTYFLCCDIAGVILDKEGRDATMATIMFNANWVQGFPTGPLLCYSQDPIWFKNLPGVG